MMANMFMMNNNILIQNLMNMKKLLTCIESQFNLLLTNTQNMGILPDTYPNLINISNQFINFGIQLLNTSIQYNKNNNIANNLDLNQQINNFISSLENIKMNIPNNMMQNMNLINFPNINENIGIFNYKPKYNVIFTGDAGLKTTIVCDREETVGELIKKLLMRIGRNELLGHEEQEFYFGYNGQRFNANGIKSKKVKQIFDSSPIQSVEYFTINALPSKKF